ncbi:MAG: SH3 domain-containing protein [Oscillatoriales cyanobacterium C42_A2020_001]|nr:SH3 domain-containing protein [Leptolyngbyaceae cyanobacterium C42_A2020_001]
MYAKPSLKEQKIGTGKGGDRVTILEQVGSNEGYTWNYVRFDNPPNLEGWVRTDYLSFQIPKEPPALLRQSNQGRGDRQNAYQGNSQQPSGYTQQSSSPDFISGIQQTIVKLFKKS